MLAAQLALQRQQDLEQRRAAVRARKHEVAATREAKTQRQEEVQAQAKAVREAGRRGKTKRAHDRVLSFATGVHTTGGGSRAAAAPPAPPPAAGPGAAVPELRERGGRRGAGDGGEQSAMIAQALALKPYKELQAMAKVRGICANGKKDAMVAALAEHGASGGGGKPALGGGGGCAGHKRKRKAESSKGKAAAKSPVKAKSAFKDLSIKDLKKFGGKSAKGSTKEEVRMSILDNSSAAQMKAILEKSGHPIQTPTGGKGKVPTAAVMRTLRRNMLCDIWKIDYDGRVASCRTCCESHRLDSSSQFFAAERVFGRRLAGYCYSCRCYYEKKDLKSGIVRYGLCGYHHVDHFDGWEVPDHVVLLSR